MATVLNCQITSIKKKNAKFFKIFLHSSKILLKRLSWTFDVEKLRTITFNIAKIHKLLLKREISHA